MDGQHSTNTRWSAGLALHDLSGGLPPRARRSWSGQEGRFLLPGEVDGGVARGLDEEFGHARVAAVPGCIPPCPHETERARQPHEDVLPVAPAPCLIRWGAVDVG